MKGRCALRKGISMLGVASIVITTLVSPQTIEAATRVPNITEEDEDLLSIVHEAISYEDYLKNYDYADYPDTEIIVYGGDFIDASEGFIGKEHYMDSEASVVLTQEEGSVTWNVEIPQAGFYNIAIEYYPMEGKNSSIERELYINEEIPFDGAQYLEFSRAWENASEIKRDSRENDVRPKQQEVASWQLGYFKDSDGYYTESYDFYFDKGINEITLSSVKEPMAISKIILTQENSTPTYEEYITKAKTEGAVVSTSKESIKVQGEDAVLKSDSTLYPMSDRTSPVTEPYHASKTRLNTIGGSNWKMVGQWITWDIEVAEDGLYEIAFKYRQNIKSGVTVVRSLKIDGETPFKEAEELKFLYKNDWQIMKLGGEEAYQFYLKKGKHTITMEVALGEEIADLLRIADESIYELNRAYRQLLMVIGTSPDALRDYQLEVKTPEALKILEEQYYIIKDLAIRLEAYSKGSKGSDSVTIDNLLNQLETMYKKPESIAKQWSAFKDNIVSLGSWALSMKEQPLEIDYLLLQTPGSKLPKVKAGVFAKMVHEIKAFLASFSEDYDSIGEVYEGETLDVWMLADGASVTSMSGSGRDQATVIKDLVDNYFVPTYDIPVNIKLVNKDVLLSATLAGEGPDVALGVGGKEPINYALRNAVTDLTQFEDFEEVRERFQEDALVQFTYNDGVYALPQTMSFQVLFYRADILKELGLEVPNTLDEFYQCLSVIQKNNMNIGTVPDYTSYAMYLYQSGGEYYSEDGKSSGLDSEAAVQAFTRWTSNYANYKMPVSYDFANRFRTGEMPLAIADYTNYTYLSVFAPEIRGLWGFTTVPGYVDEEGQMDKSVIASQSASIILDTSDQKEEAWKFLKWWMSEETQTSYGNEIENVLGVSGRVATANLQALENLPWSNRDYKQLKKQLSWVKVVPEIPGGYFTERHVKNAFYTVYNSQEDPRETLEDIVKTIDNEITNKRIEFGLDTK